MYRIVNNIHNVLYEKELDSLKQFENENPEQEIKVYYVTGPQGMGFSFIATTEKPKYNDKHILYFGNHVDITDYHSRLEEF